MSTPTASPLTYTRITLALERIGHWRLSEVIDEGLYWLEGRAVLDLADELERLAGDLEDLEEIRGGRA